MSDYTLDERFLPLPFSTDVLGAGGDNASSRSLLPATYRTKNYKIRLVSADIHSFLKRELDLERLNCIHKWLPLVGLPTQPRPLHYQILKRRTIVAAEQLDLHLVWSPSRIFIKPLPRFLLSPDFWKRYICQDLLLYQTAIGFLLSWVALIERESDHKIAVDNGLIPEEVSWNTWLVIAQEIMLSSEGLRTSVSGLKAPMGLSNRQISVHRRFYYGELRVGRLNWIYRLCKLQFRGYWSGCTTYGAFFRENIVSLIALFGYTTIVLSAMQVGLATPWLAENYAFGMASYTFSIFAIVGPVAAIAALFGVFTVFFTLNLLHTIHVRRQREKEKSRVSGCE
ncbi:hypothetical protein CC80DRAFT_521191 [Byssothecium circinans]|uniref:Uncharacterized protein n=1 Tax=Byssothecium circinans TaxID=147558 RepID=A0A6A5T5W0_9PLEO|nr:hypothetical protein CC80DRAFT_521191 [Byssothecium circinans]